MFTVSLQPQPTAGGGGYPPRPFKVTADELVCEDGTLVLVADDEIVAAFPAAAVRAIVRDGAELTPPAQQQHRMVLGGGGGQVDGEWPGRGGGGPVGTGEAPAEGAGGAGGWPDGDRRQPTPLAHLPAADRDDSASL